MRLLHPSCALICLALLHSCSAFSWKPCADAESKSSVNSVSLSPESPYPGSTAKFRIDATAGTLMHFGSELGRSLQLCDGSDKSSVAK